MRPEERLKSLRRGTRTLYWRSKNARIKTRTKEATTPAAMAVVAEGQPSRLKAWRNRTVSKASRNTAVKEIKARLKRLPSLKARRVFPSINNVHRWISVLL